MIGYLLFYKPPCGRWYVHSHKIYPTREAAEGAAEQFLEPTTPRAIRPIDLDVLEQSS